MMLGNRKGIQLVKSLWQQFPTLGYDLVTRHNSGKVDQLKNKQKAVLVMVVSNCCCVMSVMLMC